jgi:hypothetical protein|tara:strand:- start:79 stop:1725 length:1647 start_codon:yes stop_codon:yes gene_type:complete
MKKILTAVLGTAFLLGCSTLSQKQDSPTSQEQNKQAADASFEQRMKLARKPYAFLAVDYMDVADGKEKLYLEVEAAWQKIHERMASDGKILSWGLAKARKNKFGYEYITWKLLRSRGALDSLYDMEAIKQWMGEDKFEDLMAKTMDSRQISGSELMALEDYTLVPLSESDQQVDPKNLLFHMDFMTTAEGKEQEYVEMEKNVFQPRHQKIAELNPSFQFWRLFRKISHSGNANKASYRTVNAFRKDVKPLSDKETEKVNSQLPAFPEGLTYQEVMKIREMERVTFDVISMLDPSASAEAKAWKELTGTWTATNSNGSYRTKIINPYREEIKYFNASGKLTGHQIKPMSIEFKNGLKFFSAHMPGGAYTSIFEVHNGKWYEQLRTILDAHAGAPDRFFIYERSDKPAKIDRSSFTKEGEDVKLVKAIVENYASGKIDEYLALFTEDAKVTHNNNEPITISELAEIHRAHHKQIAGPVKILSSNYEVVTTANGNKYGHAWIKFENSYKNGSKAVTPVFVSFGINNNGKVYFEHALYDTATVPDDSVYNKN